MNLECGKAFLEWALFSNQPKQQQQQQQQQGSVIMFGSLAIMCHKYDQLQTQWIYLFV